MRLRALAGLGLLACIGVGGTAVGCYDEAVAGPQTALSIKRYPTAPPGQTTEQPPPPSPPPGRFSDFSRGVKGKP
jgi:hypothetical protein